MAFQDRGGVSALSECELAMMMSVNRNGAVCPERLARGPGPKPLVVVLLRFGGLMLLVILSWPRLIRHG